MAKNTKNTGQNSMTPYRGGGELSNVQDESLAQEIAGNQRSEDANKYLKQWRDVRQNQGLAKFNQLQGRVQHLMNNPQEINPQYSKELIKPQRQQQQQQNSEDNSRQKALQAVKQKAKKKTKDKKDKAGQKKEKAAKRRQKSGAKYNPIIYLFTTIYALTIEVILLVVGVISGSISSYLDWIVDYFILYPTLGLFLWTQGQGKGRTKKIVMKLTAAVGLETIPYLDYLPWWTIAVVWAWIEARSNYNKNL